MSRGPSFSIPSPFSPLFLLIGSLESLLVATTYPPVEWMAIFRRTLEANIVPDLLTYVWWFMAIVHVIEAVSMWNKCAQVGIRGSEKVKWTVGVLAMGVVFHDHFDKLAVRNKRIS
ncbi:hypothetical protein BT69DRAFT_1316867 [Atractiella rhizophila]|nr:hypothetical protein BT69DRAFT_1316867 [Atractiella rhizophila]